MNIRHDKFCFLSWTYHQQEMSNLWTALLLLIMIIPLSQNPLSWTWQSTKTCN